MIKDYVAEVTERSLQRRLRDVNRNIDFRKVVVKETPGHPLQLICESDDVVLAYNLEGYGRLGQCYWFFKRDDKMKMLQQDIDVIGSLAALPSIRNNQYRGLREAALGKLRMLAEVVRFYLG